MPVNKEDKINFNEKDDVMMLFHEIKSEYPSVDELDILTAVANVAGWEVPPSSKKEGKKIILKILKIGAST